MDEMLRWWVYVGVLLLATYTAAVTGELYDQAYINAHVVDIPSGSHPDYGKRVDMLFQKTDLPARDERYINFLTYHTETPFNQSIYEPKVVTVTVEINAGVDPEQISSSSDGFYLAWSTSCGQEVVCEQNSWPSFPSLLDTNGNTPDWSAYANPGDDTALYPNPRLLDFTVGNIAQLNLVPPTSAQCGCTAGDQYGNYTEMQWRLAIIHFGTDTSPEVNATFDYTIIVTDRPLCGDGNHYDISTSRCECAVDDLPFPTTGCLEEECCSDAALSLDPVLEESVTVNDTAHYFSLKVPNMTRRHKAPILHVDLTLQSDCVISDKYSTNGVSWKAVVQYSCRQPEQAFDEAEYYFKKNFCSFDFYSIDVDPRNLTDVVKQIDFPLSTMYNSGIDDTCGCDGTYSAWYDITELNVKVELSADARDLRRDVSSCKVTVETSAEQVDALSCGEDGELQLLPSQPEQVTNYPYYESPSNVFHDAEWAVKSDIQGSCLCPLSQPTPYRGCLADYGTPCCSVDRHVVDMTEESAGVEDDTLWTHPATISIGHSLVEGDDAVVTFTEIPRLNDSYNINGYTQPDPSGLRVRLWPNVTQYTGPMDAKMVQFEVKFRYSCQHEERSTRSIEWYNWYNSFSVGSIGIGSIFANSDSALEYWYTDVDEYKGSYWRELGIFEALYDFEDDTCTIGVQLLEFPVVDGKIDLDTDEEYLEALFNAVDWPHSGVLSCGCITYWEPWSVMTDIQLLVRQNTVTNSSQASSISYFSTIETAQEERVDAVDFAVSVGLQAYGGDVCNGYGYIDDITSGYPGYTEVYNCNCDVGYKVFMDDCVNYECCQPDHSVSAYPTATVSGAVQLGDVFHSVVELPVSSDPTFFSDDHENPSLLIQLTVNLGGETCVVGDERSSWSSPAAQWRITITASCEDTDDDARSNDFYTEESWGACVISSTMHYTYFEGPDHVIELEFAWHELNAISSCNCGWNTNGIDALDVQVSRIGEDATNTTVDGCPFTMNYTVVEGNEYEDQFTMCADKGFLMFCTGDNFGQDNDGLTEYFNLYGTDRIWGATCQDFSNTGYEVLFDVVDPEVSALWSSPFISSESEYNLVPLAWCECWQDEDDPHHEVIGQRCHINATIVTEVDAIQGYSEEVSLAYGQQYYMIARWSEEYSTVERRFDVFSTGDKSLAAEVLLGVETHANCGHRSDWTTCLSGAYDVSDVLGVENAGDMNDWREGANSMINDYATLYGDGTHRFVMASAYLDDRVSNYGEFDEDHLIYAEVYPQTQCGCDNSATQSSSFFSSFEPYPSSEWLITDIIFGITCATEGGCDLNVTFSGEVECTLDCGQVGTCVYTGDGVDQVCECPVGFRGPTCELREDTDIVVSETFNMQAEVFEFPGNSASWRSMLHLSDSNTAVDVEMSLVLYALQEEALYPDSWSSDISDDVPARQLVVHFIASLEGFTTVQATLEQSVISKFHDSVIYGDYQVWAYEWDVGEEFIHVSWNISVPASSTTGLEAQEYDRIVSLTAVLEELTDELPNAPVFMEIYIEGLQVSQPDNNAYAPPSDSLRVFVRLEDAYGNLYGMIALMMLVGILGMLLLTALFQSRKIGMRAWCERSVLNLDHDYTNLVRKELEEAEGVENPLAPPPAPGRYVMMDRADNYTDLQMGFQHNEETGYSYEEGEYEELPEEFEHGVTKLQALARGRATRKKLRRRQEAEAAVLIQSMARGHLSRKKHRRHRHSSSKHHHKKRRGSRRGSKRHSSSHHHHSSSIEVKVDMDGLQDVTHEAPKGVFSHRPAHKQPQPPVTSPAVGATAAIAPVGGPGAQYKSNKVVPMSATMLERLKHEQDGEEDDRPMELKVPVIVLLIAMFFLFIGAMVLDAFVVMFNISLMHNSLGGVVDIVDFSELERVIEDVAADFKVPSFAFIYSFFSGMFAKLDFLQTVGLSWNCGGAISMFSPVSLLLGILLLLVILQQDWLLRTAITLRGKATGANAIVKKGAAMGLTMMSIYILQAAIISLTDVVASSWGIQRSCNEFDRQLVVVGQYLCVVVIIFFIYVAVLMFAGIQSLDKKALTIGWLQGAFNLLQISLGIWTPATVKSFQVVGKANKFDNNDEDDDNQQETVMSLVGQSRGLIFLPIVGFGVLLTKSAQYLNEPPWLIFSRYKMPALQLYSGSKERFVRFIMNIGQYAMTVIVVLGGDRDSVILLTLSIIVNAFVKYSFFFYHIMKKRAEDKKVAEAQAAAKAVLTVPT